MIPESSSPMFTIKTFNGHISIPVYLILVDGPGIPNSISNLLEEFTAIKGLDSKPELAHRLDK
jgi:hypothetical protein